MEWILPGYPKTRQLNSNDNEVYLVCLLWIDLIVSSTLKKIMMSMYWKNRMLVQRWWSIIKNPGLMINLTKQLPLDFPQNKTFMRMLRTSTKFRTVPRWCYWESNFLGHKTEGRGDGWPEKTNKQYNTKQKEPKTKHGASGEACSFKSTTSAQTDRCRAGWNVQWEKLNRWVNSVRGEDLVAERSTHWLPFADSKLHDIGEARSPACSISSCFTDTARLSSSKQPLGSRWCHVKDRPQKINAGMPMSLIRKKTTWDHWRKSATTYWPFCAVAFYHLEPAGWQMDPLPQRTSSTRGRRATAPQREKWQTWKRQPQAGDASWHLTPP